MAFYGLTLSDFASGAQPTVTGQPLLTVGFNRRFSEPILRIRELVAQRQNPLVAVYRVNAGYVAPQDWVHGPEGGGRFVGEACHMVDVLRFLVGSPVRRVSLAEVAPSTKHVLSSDNVAMTLEYEDGSLCTLVYTALGTSELGKEQLEVFWDGKAIVLDDYRHLRVLGMKGKDWTSSYSEKGHKHALEAFGRCLSSNPPCWPIPLTEIVETTLVTLGGAS